MKNKNLNCKECGNNEFVADSNKYDIFKVKEGKLSLDLSFKKKEHLILSSFLLKSTMLLFKPSVPKILLKKQRLP